MAVVIDQRVDDVCGNCNDAEMLDARSVVVDFNVCGNDESVDITRLFMHA